MPPPESHQEFSAGNRHEQLRLSAQARLKTGANGPNSGWALSSEALSRLYNLASSPESAGDALKLLHELQTHQVELEIQHEQLEASEGQTAGDLALYRTLFESAPVGYFLLGLEGHIIDCNQAATELLGRSRGQLCGQPLASLLTLPGRDRLSRCLEQLQHSGTAASCVVPPAEKEQAGQMSWQLHGRLAPGKEAILLTLSPQDPLRDT